MAKTRRDHPIGAAIASSPRRSSSGRAARTRSMTGCAIPIKKTPGRLSDSLPEEILAFLRKHGLAAAGETPPAEALSGGVSSEIWRVPLKSGQACIKRALPPLRVAQLWEAPGQRNRYERPWLETANALVPRAPPQGSSGGEDSF